MFPAQRQAECGCCREWRPQHHLLGRGANSPYPELTEDKEAVAGAVSSVTVSLQGQKQRAVAFCSCPSWPGPAQGDPKRGCQPEMLSQLRCPRVQHRDLRDIRHPRAAPGQHCCPLGPSACQPLTDRGAQLPPTHTHPGVTRVGMGTPSRAEPLVSLWLLCACPASHRPCWEGHRHTGGCPETPQPSAHITHPSHLRAPPARQPKSHKWGKVTTKPWG